MEEYKVGEEIDYNGKILVVVASPTSSCTKCFFSNKEHCSNTKFTCGGMIRRDFTNVIFIEKDAI